jgi:hypothetical protein
MKKPRTYTNLLAYILMPALFCLLAVQSAQASEPSYKDKPLSEWLLELELKHMPPQLEPIVAQKEQPEDAIRQIGSNAIPTLLDILGATEGNKWWVLAKLKSPRLREWYGNSNTSIDDLTGVAVDGFAVLGTNALPAIPKISKMLGKWGTCAAAAQALAGMGPEGFAALTNGLRNSNSEIRGVTIQAIGEKARVDSKTVARLMIASLKDPALRVDAARYLGSKDPALAIPALLPLLDDPNPGVVWAAARSLGSYGARAEMAIPKLLSLFTNHIADPDRQSADSWRVELMWGIEPIDKDAVAKAEAFLVSSGPLGATDGYTTTVLPNGKVLLAGGRLQTAVPAKKDYFFSRAMLFDPATGKWTETGSMNIARCYHIAVLLRNGKVLVAGGTDLIEGTFHDLLSAELYDPTTGTWTEAGSMNSSHPNEQAVFQKDGKVRVSGYIGDYTKRPGDDLYDPATGTWTVVTNK